MAANYLKNHDQNPYNASKEKHQLVLFTAVDYYASKLISLSPIALQTMLVLASTLNLEGYATGTLEEIAEYLQT